MEKNILSFITRLRQAGVPVTMGETLDCMEAIKLVGFEKEKFYHALKASLVKDAAYYPAFDKVFKYFFNPGFFIDIQITDDKLKNFLVDHNIKGPGAKTDTCTGDGDMSTGTSVHGRGQIGKKGDEFTRVIQMGNEIEMANLVRKGIESIELNEKDLTNREDAIRRIKVFLEWKIGENNLSKIMDSEEDENTRLTLMERLNVMEEMLQEQFEVAHLSNFGDAAMDVIIDHINLNTLDFYQLNNNQVAEIKKKIVKMAHRLATRVSFRETRGKRGRVDIQRTIRRSMVTGGIPITLAYRKKKISRPEVVILCDISGSVKVFSEFMLQFVYSLQSRFINVRSFVFIDIVDEITEYFRNREIEDAICTMYNQATFTNSDFSDYGNVLIDFCQKYLSVLNKNTTVIILGDARNNYNRDQLEYLAKMKESCNRILWLNPEPIEDWNKEDSIIRTYAPLVNNLFECRNLKQLDRLTRKIFI